MIVAILFASVGSALAFSLFEMRDALIGVATIDCALLAVITWYALTGQRYWPIWFASFHACTVFFQLTAIFLPVEDSLIVWRIGAFWGMPALFAMAIGLTLDQGRFRFR